VVFGWTVAEVLGMARVVLVFALFWVMGRLDTGGGRWVFLTGGGGFLG